MTSSSLWQPFKLGRVELPHRLALAPMTRSRADVDGTPGELAAQYYGQRASLGLIITEGTQPSEDGQGYLNTPGIYTPEHVEGWRPVAIEVARAVAEEIGADRVGIRLSPAMPLGGIDEGDTESVRAQYRHLVGALAGLNLAYLHLHHDELLRSLRDVWPTALLVLRYGRTREQIADEIEARLADIASLGRFALAKPDVVERLRTGADLNEVDPATLYGGAAAGYTDYTTLAQTQI